MVSSEIAAIVSKVDEKRLLALELAAIRTPSSSFQEGPLADYLFKYMQGIGLDVEMMTIPHPTKEGVSSRQPVARLKGTGGGPTLMLNGHMDPGVEMTGWSVDPYEGYMKDGWIWGMGAHDDKGNVAAMIVAVEAIIASGLRPKGDILVCPVIAHKYGGLGTRALLKAGVTADMCINLEHAANTIANVCVGVIMARIRTTAPDLFFRYSDKARAAYWNPVEQQAEILRRIGPSLTPIPENSWLTFKSHPELPGFPTLTVDTIAKDHYYFPPVRPDMTSRDCEMTFQIRTVPGQTLASIRKDLERLLEGIKADHPAFSYTLTLPAGGPGDRWCQAPMETPRDHPLVRYLAEGFREATGREPEIGGYGRLGNVGDGNILAEAGIPSVQFGSGDIRIYREWPTADERVLLTDLVDTSRTIAAAAWHLTNHNQ
jgi:acetylornithine deacetylase/succinyl-diaminopimelate desuccinylase-like protein